MALTATSSAAAEQWLRLRSPHFVVIGDAAERELRRVADRVEGFRDGLVRALPNATVAMPVPMTIVVFASDAAFTPFKPIVNGRPMDRIGGYFLNGEDANYIAMTLAHGEAAYPTILHEYTHALLAETLPNAPMWLHEGLAEVYSTYSERADGRTAIIGAAPPHHVRELLGAPLLPLELLMAADAHSPLYNEAERRGMFYAEAWALVHYLLLGTPDRRGQVSDYLRLTDEGVTVPAAIRQAFGRDPKALEADLREYARLFALNGVEVALSPGRRQRLAMSSERIPQAEATTYTVELLARLGRPDEARRAIDAVLAAAPDLPRGLAALGRLHVRAGRVDEGLPLLARAVERLPTDAAAAATYARALVDRLRARGSRAASEDVEELARVGRALETAAALDPDDTFVIAMQGYVALLAGGRLEPARLLLEQAVRQSPARQDYQLLLAQALIEARDYPGAQQLLEPLLARGSQPRIREQAGILLARAADDAGLAAAAASSSRQSLILRSLEPGESQVVGLFDRIECRSDAVVLHIRTADRAVQLRTTRLDDVDFINYSDDPIAPVGCRNPDPPLRVVATFRGPIDAAPEVVAIEIVPADYTLR